MLEMSNREIQLQSEIERLRAELDVYKFREKENLYKTFVINSPDIIILVDREYKYEFIHIPGVPQEKLDGLIGKDLVSSTPEKLRPKMIESVEKVFNQKETVVYESDAESMGKYRYYLNYLSPILDSKGEVRSAYFVSRDITENKINELELNALNLNLKTLFQSLNHLYTISDLNQRVLWFNDGAAKFTEEFYGVKLAKGLRASEIFPAELYMDFNACFQLACTGQITKYYRKYTKPDGTSTTYEINLHPIFENEKLIAIANIAIDISDLVRKEEISEKINKELISQNQQLNQFTYIISHNLRSPITTLMGIANVIDMYKDDSSLVNQLIPQIINSAKKLDVIITDLNYVLNQSDENSQLPQEINLHEIIEVIKEVNGFPGKNITINTDFTDVSKLFSIKSYIYSILFNLISNSIKYKKLEEEVIILVSARNMPDGMVELSIDDNGLGIDLEKYGDKIFGFYKRFHYHVDGKGLGLHITKKQVDYLGGNIRVESQPNVGTRFIIQLPNKEINYKI